MRLTTIPPAIAGFFETRIRQARFARRQARLHRALSRLPAYIARDIDLERIIEPVEKAR